MLGLIQRVTSASVSIEENIHGHINQGILLLLGVEKNDATDQADQLLKKILNYRIFTDDSGKMNQSLTDITGELLVVSQFTLAADTKKGLRPSFSSAAPPTEAEILYDYFLDQANKIHNGKIASGQFGADMQVSLCNDGPVTFLLSS
ncbi:MAG: D-aminoacyl-tRNA deacylase [Cellvibrionales bacterium UBA7375]|nr:D-tyrosyl-tRNA(Tyr) deacylase [Gammaproteobacteria bacterium]CAI8162413.1 MAG: D-aminoacyl-tRNA deacylase [Cellvibrionales bacterium UBA7375]